MAATFKYWGVLLFIASAIQLNAQVSSLEQKVTIRFRGASVKEALDALKTQLNCIINYKTDEIPKERIINKEFVEVPLKSIVIGIWGTENLKIRLKDNIISIKKVSGEETNRGLGQLQGKILNSNSEPVPFATIAVKGTSRGAVADENGFFRLNRLEIGTTVLQISSTGYELKELSAVIKINRITEVNTVLSTATSTLDEVIVEGKSFAREIAEQPIAISTINAVKLQSQTQDVAKVLDKVEGVRIRQSGGLGSTTNISINGLTGNAIRFYYNGIPSEFLGGGFQINTLPISNVDRIEVYKGVMPASIGTDALGGGINIATSTDGDKKIDLSYQFGSFNTHRAAASITRPVGEKWFFNVNANYNYSDNNFEMEVENNTYEPGLPFPTGVETIKIKRFHDAFSAFLGNVQAGYHNKEKQLSLLVMGYVTATDKEFQHGARVNFVPIGELSAKSQDTYFKFDLEKKVADKWQLKYSGIAGYSRLQVRDSTRNIYDWRGRNITEINPEIERSNGAELLALPSISDVYSYNTVHRFGIVRQLPHNLFLSLNHFFAYQNREGSEELTINYIAGRDPNENGFLITRNITALELKKQLFSDRLEVLSTLKSYHYRTEGVNTSIRNTAEQTELPIVTNREQAWGYNIASKWKINDKLFIRTSYENALRIPAQNEIFGDLRTIRPNFSLRPERSRNFNAGFNADISTFLKASVNYFVRSQRDGIILQLLDTENARFINRRKIHSAGAELTLRGAITKNFSYSWNTTYFNLEIREVEQPQDQFLVGSPVPNIPTFFSNMTLSYQFNDTFEEDNKLLLNVDTQFVDEFSFIQQGRIINEDFVIPTQFAVDAGFTYNIKEYLTLNFQANNLFDAELFDFLSVPKPGRNFAVKVRYTL
ncbi:MAG: TonB-dependent receptor [Bacteroidota bacterium]